MRAMLQMGGDAASLRRADSAALSSKRDKKLPKSGGQKGKAIFRLCLGRSVFAFRAGRSWLGGLECLSGALMSL